MENEVIINADIRTPEKIAVEINATIDIGRRQLRTVYAQTVIAVGNLLSEAKELVAHGEWEDWIRANMSFTPKSARRYMHLAKEYGEMLEGVEISKRTLLSDLSFSDAVDLLSLSEEGRVEAVETILEGEMNPSDAAAEIRRLKEELERLEDDRGGETIDTQSYETALKEAEELRAKVSDYDQKIEKLKAEQKKLKDKQTDAVREAADKEISALRKDIEEQASAASKEEMAKLEERLKDAEDRAARAEKEKALAASEEKTSFLIVMKDMQMKFYAALELAMSTALPDEDREKMKAALLTVLDALKNRIG